MYWYVESLDLAACGGQAGANITWRALDGGVIDPSAAIAEVGATNQGGRFKLHVQARDDAGNADEPEPFEWWVDGGDGLIRRIYV